MAYGRVHLVQVVWMQRSQLGSIISKHHKCRALRMKSMKDMTYLHCEGLGTWGQLPGP